MITFRSFSLVISIVLLRQVALQSAGASASDAVGTEHPLHWLIAGCVLFGVISKFLPVAAMIRADSIPRLQAWREMEQNRNWLEWTWLLAQGWLLTSSGAAHLFASAEQQGWSPALMMCVWFLPAMAFLAVLEFSFTQLECLWSADGDQSSAAHWKRWWTRVRLGPLGHVITCLMPVLVLLAAMDAIHYGLPKLPELWRAALALICLGLIGLTFAPLWLRFWNGAKPATDEQPVVQRVRFFCEQLNVSAPTVCWVGQGQAWHGIALVGWTPLFRQLWIGPAVASSLTAEQLDMVVLHELAHLKRGHCWWRIIPLLIAGVSCVAALTNWPLNNGFGVGQLLSSLAFALGMIWMLGRISRQCELDADWQACQLATRHCTWAAEQPGRAMTMLADALVVLHDPEKNPAHDQWLHPSLARRMAVKP